MVVDSIQMFRRFAFLAQAVIQTDHNLKNHPSRLRQLHDFGKHEFLGESKCCTRCATGELGGLIVSTPILPRYRIGDFILAMRPPFFRCIGREEWWTPLRYAWDECTSLNFGQL